MIGARRDYIAGLSPTRGRPCSTTVALQTVHEGS